MRDKAHHPAYEEPRQTPAESCETAHAGQPPRPQRGYALCTCGVTGTGRGGPCPPGHQSSEVSGLRLGSGFFAFLLPRLSPSDWLQRRQMVRALSGWSVPPWLGGMMWSGSGLLGRRLFSQSRGTPHVRPRWCLHRPSQGQCVMCLSLCRTMRTVRFHRAVPVLEVAIVHHLPRA